MYVCISGRIPPSIKNPPALASVHEPELAFASQAMMACLRHIVHVQNGKYAEHLLKRGIFYLRCLPPPVGRS